MVKFINAPFVTEKTANKTEKIKDDIKKGTYVSRVCFIVMSSSKTDVFDIVPMINLKFKFSEYNDLNVIGIAESKRAAVRLCAKLAQIYLKSGSNLTMREYFEEYIQENLIF